MSLETVTNYEAGITQRNRIWNYTRYAFSTVFNSPEHPHHIVVQNYDLGSGITLNLGKTTAPGKQISGDAVMIMGTDYTKCDYAFAVLGDGATVGGGADYKASETIIASAKTAIDYQLKTLQNSNSRLNEEEVIRDLLTNTRDFALDTGRRGTSTVNLVVVNTRTGNVLVRYLGDSPIYAMHDNQPLIKASADHTKVGVGQDGRTKKLLGAGICLHNSRFSADHTAPVEFNLGYEIESLTRRFNILGKGEEKDMNVNGVVITSDGIDNLKLSKGYTQKLKSTQGMATFIEHGVRTKEDDQTIIYIEGKKRIRKQNLMKVGVGALTALAIGGVMYGQSILNKFIKPVEQTTPTAQIRPTLEQIIATSTSTATVEPSATATNTEVPPTLTNTPTATETKQPTPTRQATATLIAPTATIRPLSTRIQSTPVPERNELNTAVESGKIYSLFDQETKTMLQFRVNQYGGIEITKGANGLFNEGLPITTFEPGQPVNLTWGNGNVQTVTIEYGVISVTQGTGDELR